MESVTPCVDIAFKKIFGVEENKDLLISLINSIVSKEDQVVDITLLNPYNPQNFKNDRLSIIDVQAVGAEKKIFNIELQINNESDSDKRDLYCWAKLYIGQLEEYKDYSLLSKTIGIHILNFTSTPESKKYHNVFHIVEKDNACNDFTDLELHTVELKKFSDAVGTELSGVVNKIKTSLDMWAAFLTKYNLLDKDHLPENLENVALKKALNVLEAMNFNHDEREKYEAHLKWLRVENDALKKSRQDGREKGLEEDMAMGKK